MGNPNFPRWIMKIVWFDLIPTRHAMPVTIPNLKTAAKYDHTKESIRYRTLVSQS
jgi:hypothetical protein